MKELIKQNLTAIIPTMLVVITANMYYVGYQVDIEELKLLSIPSSMIEIKSADYYILKAAIPSLYSTATIIVVCLVVYFRNIMNIQNGTFPDIARLILYSSIIEMMIISTSIFLYKKYYTYNENNTVTNITYKNKDTQFTLQKDTSLIYETKDYIFLSLENSINQVKNIQVLNKKEIYSFDISPHQN